MPHQTHGPVKWNSGSVWNSDLIMLRPCLPFKVDFHLFQRANGVHAIWSVATLNVSRKQNNVFQTELRKTIASGLRAETGTFPGGEGGRRLSGQCFLWIIDVIKTLSDTQHLSSWCQAWHQISAMGLAVFSIRKRKKESKTKSKNWNNTHLSFPWKSFLKDH